MMPSRPQSDRPREQSRPDAAHESIFTLLAQLVHASLRSAFDRVPIRYIDKIITACTLYATAVPLLLWVSYSKTGYVVLICGAALAIAIIYLLIWLYPEDPF